jgi:hypothetical protein
MTASDPPEEDAPMAWTPSDVDVAAVERELRRLYPLDAECEDGFGRCGEDGEQ